MSIIRPTYRPFINICRQMSSESKGIQIILKTDLISNIYKSFLILWLFDFFLLNNKLL
jgi:hypothetical protein